MTLSVLSDHIIEHTRLDGGVNCFFKITNSKKIFDYDLCLDILNKAHVLVLSASCFSISPPKLCSSYYFRLSLSIPSKEYKRRLLILKQYFDCVNGRIL